MGVPVTRRRASEPHTDSVFWRLERSALSLLTGRGLWRCVVPALNVFKHFLFFQFYRDIPKQPNLADYTFFMALTCVYSIDCTQQSVVCKTNFLVAVRRTVGCSVIHSCRRFCVDAR